jgi:tetratricopeptide (TPR) repeat protein
MREPLPLVGRESEVVALRRALDEHRWVTLWGPAGVGKSRLAREAASRLDAVTFCDLAVVEDEASLWQVLATALGLEGAGRSLARAVARALEAGGGTVVLDGADGIRHILAAWLPTLPVRVLVTASGAFGHDEEHAFELEPLSVEAASELWQAATRRLGHTSTRTMGEAIAVEFEGLPLALEWFAPRAALLGDDASRAWLEARPATSPGPLSLALEQALDGLDGDEQGALERIAMFEQGVPTVMLPALAVDLDTVQRLAGRALLRVIRHAEPAIAAYWSARERVRSRIRDAGRWVERSIEHAHFVIDADEAARLLPDLDAVVKRLAEVDPDLALRACTLRAEHAVDDGSAARCVGHIAELIPRAAHVEPATHLALGRLLRRLARLDEARDHLRVADEAGSFEARIELAHVDRMQSRTDEALQGYVAALEAAKRAGDRAAEGHAYGEVGRMLQTLGRHREAQRHHEEAIAIGQRLGLHRRVAMERSLHARATHRAGDVSEAIVLHRRALELHRELGLRRLAAAEMGHLGYCHHELGQTTEAEACFHESIGELARLGDVVLEAIERLQLARLLADEARYAEAQLELAQVRAAAEAGAMPRLDLTRLLVAGFVALGRGDREAAADAWRRAAALGPQLEVGFEALLPLHLAWLEGASDEVAIAAWLKQVQAVESPALGVAASLWAAAALGQPAEPSLLERAEAHRSQSSDLRRALRWLADPDGAAVAWHVAEDGRAFRHGSSIVALGRRAAPRRLLLALVAARLERPGEVLSFDALVAAGWPDEKMSHEAARKRLRTAIWTLRKLGLEAVLLTRDSGYLLDPTVELAWVPSDQLAPAATRKTGPPGKRK